MDRNKVYLECSIHVNKGAALDPEHGRALFIMTLSYPKETYWCSPILARVNLPRINNTKSAFVETVEWSGSVVTVRQKCYKNQHSD